MRNRKRRYVNFLMNWRLVLQQVSYEATKSIYSYTYLVSATYPFKDQIKVVPEKLIEGKSGRENLDYGIESRTTGRIIGLVEVKKDVLSGVLQKPLYSWNRH
ncbi:hypothetical protein RirG_047060 [Rhizophagus irregularis DAOM 197198w]|uniref:Uncharacterized protein n=1 Tax=Rhizophagus irregularis (strain DAOM 197198w) TaxID=1432141 RepID=A0A015N6Q1_RHIIW|nr:hypothetical protein RirG_047060 [Rhizophagus irregularis DAOM 197198w]